MKTYLVLLLCIPVSISDQKLNSAQIAHQQVPQRFNSKNEMYRKKPWLDITAILAFDARPVYGMSVIYHRDSVPVADILALNRNDVK